MGKRVVVTGISGFIGSAFVRRVCDEASPWASSLADWTFVGLARNSDQGNLRRLDGAGPTRAQKTGKLRIVYGDILGDISGLCEGADAVVHFAAKTFVDHCYSADTEVLTTDGWLAWPKVTEQDFLATRNPKSGKF